MALPTLFHDVFMKYPYLIVSPQEVEVGGGMAFTVCGMLPVIALRLPFCAAVNV
jgi:hypothetical protein